VRTIRNTQIHSVGRMQSSSVLKRVLHIVTTGLYSVKITAVGFYTEGYELLTVSHRFMGSLVRQMLRTVPTNMQETIEDLTVAEELWSTLNKGLLVNQQVETEYSTTSMHRTGRTSNITSYR
jgi:hypothetical protein